ncbi:thiamine transporter 1-like isoform X3 [Rhynchophorus ferrugineus]|uniref:thiamine transporter 1-like isoform X3 n=1 Tax=Rhynchophorus ferrugineus TaxID=354439 RepID=UPI003FCC4F20
MRKVQKNGKILPHEFTDNLRLTMKSGSTTIIPKVFYGTFAACEVAYFTYIYAKVDKEYYQQVTSHTRAAILAGRATSGILAQSLISFKVMNYRELNYITFSAMIAATIWSLFLPPVKKTIYFHKDSSQKSFLEKNKSAYKLMWTHFVKGYSNKYNIKWSVWWALATCGFIQVQVYMQPLWTAIVNDQSQQIYNGAVEAILTVLGFLGALLAGVMKVDWKTRGELALTCCSLLQGFIMLISSQTPYVYVSYICYIVFGGLYHLTITIASSEIAKNIEEDSYGLIFGINTFIALVCQTILTLVVVTGTIGFALDIRKQYFVYGIFHVALAFVYIIIGLANWLSSKRDYRRASTVVPPPTRTIITY